MSIDLEEVKRKMDNVTKGPWKSYIEGRDHTSGSSFIMTGDANYDINFIKIRDEDQDFIALSRNIIPELIEEIEDLREKIEKYEKDKYVGMTINERLYANGYLEEFDKAVELKDVDKVTSLLKKVELNDESIKQILKSLELKIKG